MPLQIRYLFLGIGDFLLLLGDLLSLLGHLLAQALHFAAQALILATQRLPIRRWRPWAVRSSMRGSQRLLNIQIAKCFALSPAPFPLSGPRHLNCYPARSAGVSPFSLGIVSAVFIERDERTDGGQFHSIAVLSRRVLRSEKV